MSKINYNRIKSAFAEHNKTNKDAAKALGVTEQTVSRWCTNEAQPPIQKLYEIAKFLKVDIRTLLVSTDWSKKEQK
jgi:putative transcriptional regulator